MQLPFVSQYLCRNMPSWGLHRRGTGGKSPGQGHLGIVDAPSDCSGAQSGHGSITKNPVEEAQVTCAHEGHQCRVCHGDQVQVTRGGDCQGRGEAWARRDPQEPRAQLMWMSRAHAHTQRHILRSCVRTERAEMWKTKIPSLKEQILTTCTCQGNFEENFST